MTALSSTYSPLKIYYVPEVRAYFFKHSIAMKYGTPIDVTTKFRFWTDPRPLIPKDIDFLKNVANVEKDLIYKIIKILKNGTTIVNVVNDPTLDMIYEFMTNGYTVCTINYDMFSNKFVLVHNEISAALAVKEGYSYTKVVDIGEINKLRVELPENTPVPILDSEDRLIGSGIIQNSRIKIVRKWNPKNIEDILDKACKRGINYRETYELNREYIDERIRKIRKVVEYFEKKHNRKGILSFSGGKDSLLALSLLCIAESNMDVVHVHIEHGDPQGLEEYVDYIENKLGVKIVRLYSTWDLVEKYLKFLNMPTRGFRWCTPLLKFTKILKYIKDKYGFDRVVSYVGSRKSETIKRSLRPATYIDSEAGLLTHAVCYKFPKLLEYLYLWYDAKVRLFTDYMIGIERLSCIVCPFKSCLEIKLCERRYYEDFEKWKPHIYRLLRTIVKRDEDIEKAYNVHLWRFFMLHTDLQYIAGKLRIKIHDPYTYQKNSINIVNILSIDKSRKPISVKVHIPILTHSIETLINNVKSIYRNRNINFTINNSSSIIIRLDNTYTELDLSSGLLRVDSDNEEDIVDMCKIVFMSMSCIECSHCMYNCPRDCIELPFRIDSSRCEACLRCLDACVPARLYFDMILYSHLTSIRKARERIESIREKYKELLIKTRVESGLDWLRW